MQSRVFHLHTLSPLHCGIGQSAGVVDLPIARARASQLPIAPGSSLRGVLRSHLESRGEPKKAVEWLFGPRNVNNAEEARAGALAVGDAHLLLLPVRSLAGILCYATSPFVLRRYHQDLRRAGHTPPTLPTSPSDQQARVAMDSCNVIDNKLVLEDLDLPAVTEPSLTPWAEHLATTLHPDDSDGQQDLTQRLALLPDNLFSFLAETATEIRTRIAINPESGTVKRGALWYEESLPAEALLWGNYALTSAVPDDETGDSLRKALPGGETLLQLGGDAGVGRGLVRLLTLGVSHG